MEGPSKTLPAHSSRHSADAMVRSGGMGGVQLAAGSAVILRQEKFDEMSKARIALILFRYVSLRFDVV